MKVCGPETHIIAVSPMALELQPELAGADSIVSSFISAIVVKKKKRRNQSHRQHLLVIVTASAQTTSIVYGLQNRAVQGMLELD